MPIRTKQDFRKTYLCLQKTSEFESTLLMLPWSRKMAGCGGTQCHSESDQTLFRNFLNKKQSSPPPRRFGKLVAASTSYFSTSLIVYSWLQFSGLSLIETPSGSPGSVSVSSFVSVTSSSSKEGSLWSY